MLHICRCADSRFLKGFNILKFGERPIGIEKYVIGLFCGVFLQYLSASSTFAMNTAYHRERLGRAHDGLNRYSSSWVTNVELQITQGSSTEAQIFHRVRVCGVLQLNASSNSRRHHSLSRHTPA